ncbi:MAG TPA: lantibiotic dehydratase, partial [Sphingobacteriaceae bacterium]
MNSYEFYPWLVVRVPRLPLTMVDTPLQEMLDNPVFRDALYLASDVFFAQLQKIGFSEKNSSRKIRETLAKYQRRICTRSTPYGGFASTAITGWTNASDTLRVDRDSFQTVVLERQGPTGIEPLLRLNPSLYKYGAHYRLYERTAESSGGVVLSEVDGSAIAEGLINFVRGAPREVILDHLRTYGLSRSEAEQYTSELLQSGVLIDGAPRGSVSVVPFSGHQSSGNGSQLYCHTRHDVAGGIDIQLQNDIRDGVHCLAQLSLPHINRDLKVFRERFQERFDRQQVPLLTALDPEAGVGYSIDLPGSPRENSPAWSQVHELLLRKWTAHKRPELPVIRLEEDDLSHLHPSPVHYHTPGLAVMFSKLEHGIHLHAAGGVSSLNLIGRLTAFDYQLHIHAREIAAIEQERNPDVIFAEIVFDTGDRTDKLNLRTDFRNYVIPMLTSVDASDENIILLNDLYLSLVHGKLILWSKRLNKRVVPRLTSAYNYRRETFAVFRFLCDLQDEEIQSNLHFSMERLFPGLPFYPAVYYKNILLQRASWHLEGRLFHIMQEEPDSAFDRFCSLAAELQLPPVFVYEEHDQHLMIRSDVPGDFNMLLQTVKQKKE